MKRIKLITIIGILGLLGIVASNSRQFSSSAKGDDVFSEIGKYKKWKQINKVEATSKNGSFKIDNSSAMG